MTQLNTLIEQLTQRWAKTSLRGRIVLLVGCVLAIAVVLRGCVNGGPRLSGGAETVEELVAKYEDAHRRKSIRQLRKILWWEAARPSWASGHPQGLEQLMREAFSVPLAEVKYVAGPPPDAEFAAEAIYYIPGPKRNEDGMIGPVYGKLLGQRKVPGTVS